MTLIQWLIILDRNILAILLFSTTALYTPPNVWVCTQRKSLVKMFQICHVVYENPKLLFTFNSCYKYTLFLPFDRTFHQAQPLKLWGVCMLLLLLLQKWSKKLFQNYFNNWDKNKWYARSTEQGRYENLFT